MHILTIDQKVQLDNIAINRLHLNSITDAERIQNLNVAYADLKNEWATEIVKAVFNRDGTLDDETVLRLEVHVSAAIEGYYQWSTAMVIYHKATDDRYTV